MVKFETVVCSDLCYMDSALCIVSGCISKGWTHQTKEGRKCIEGSKCKNGSGDRLK